jgi:hypothetical protein|tara:strand:- start:134 stop:439 length:306 start_codon:yes stop_codon:yes gene_type:complete
MLSNLDSFLTDDVPFVEEISCHRLVPFYLMSSYLYYKKDKSVLSDGDYDMLCKRLYKEWDNVKHPHKHLIDKESLLAGTGYQLKYTNMIMGAAETWYGENE